MYVYMYIYIYIYIYIHILVHGQASREALEAAQASEPTALLSSPAPPAEGAHRPFGGFAKGGLVKGDLAIHVFLLYHYYYYY